MRAHAVLSPPGREIGYCPCSVRIAVLSLHCSLASLCCVPVSTASVNPLTCICLLLCALLPTAPLLCVVPAPNKKSSGASFRFPGGGVETNPGGGRGACSPVSGKAPQCCRSILFAQQLIDNPSCLVRVALWAAPNRHPAGMSSGYANALAPNDTQRCLWCHTGPWHDMVVGCYAR